jgi:Tol biopolymer transport system component
MNESMDQELAAWLHEGPESGPREGLERALAATRRVGQRPEWTLPERWLPVQLTMTRTRSQRAILAVLLLALLTVALVAAALYIGSQRREMPPPLFRNGAVVYAADGDLFIADQLGGMPRPLVAGPENDSDPVFSPQGDRIAFVRSVQDETGRIDPLEDMLMTVRPDGSDVTELAMPGSVASFDWSPDGGALLVMTYAHGGDEIDGTPALKVIQSDGSGSRTLDIEGRPASGAWRLDGRQIAFVRTSGGSAAYIADADGTNARELQVGADRLAWSPDGKHLSFMSAPDDTDQVNIADIAGDGTVSDVRELGLDPGSTAVTGAEWSPDGSQLAFVLRADAALRVAIADAEGSGYRLVGPGVTDDQVAVDLTWAPDGRSLVVFEREAPNPRVWSVDVMTGQLVEIQTPVESWQRLAP